MIFKSDLLDAINELSCDIAALGIRVSDLERKAEEKPKKKIGRPVGSKDKQKRKCKTANNTKQPRGKDGKFTKKK